MPDKNRSRKSKNLPQAAALMSLQLENMSHTDLNLPEVPQIIISVLRSASRTSITGYSWSASHMVVHTVMLIGCGMSCLFSVYSEDKT